MLQSCYQCVFWRNTDPFLSKIHLIKTLKLVSPGKTALQAHILFIMFAKRKVFLFIHPIRVIKMWLFGGRGAKRAPRPARLCVSERVLCFYQECTPQVRPSPDLFPRGSAALRTESLSILSVMVHRTGKPPLQILPGGRGRKTTTSSAQQSHNGAARRRNTTVIPSVQSGGNDRECCASSRTDLPSYVSSVSPITAWR